MRGSKVHLREKQLAKGMVGFYLDYSMNGKRKQETLIDLRIFSKLHHSSRNLTFWVIFHSNLRGKIAVF